MYHILCTIITLFISSYLNGMETRSDYREDRLEIADRGLKAGLQLYNKGKFQEAIPHLLGGYYLWEKYDPKNKYMDPGYHKLICHAISKVQLAHNPLSAQHIDMAISFAQKGGQVSALTDIALRLTSEASKAQKQKKPELADLYHTKAFSLFEQARFTCPIAKEYYERALCYGIGCDYNPTKSLPYFLDQLKSIKNYLLLAETTQNERDNRLDYINHFAEKGNMQAQCILAGTYMNGKYHVPISHKKALDYCQQFVFKLATISSLGQLPVEYFVIPLTLKQLSFTNKKAFLLNTLYNALYIAKKDNNNNSKKIHDICSKLSKDSLFPTLVKLLCTNGKDSLINLDTIKGIRLDNKNKTLQTFCNSDEYAIIMPFLEQRLARLTEKEQNLIDAYHYIIGLCAYHHKEYEKAHKHFTECIGYANDLYTEALLFTMSSFENRLTHLESLISLLGVAQQCPQPRKRDEKAKQLIATQLNAVYEQDIRKLLRYQKYTYAYEYAYYLMQLDQTITAACDSFVRIERWAAQESEENRFKLLHCIGYRSKLYNELKEKMKAKDHGSSVCRCLHFIAAERGKYPWANETSKHTAKKNRFSYLKCVLTHTDLADDQKAHAQTICGSLACDIGITEQSLPYLDEAIAYGIDRAYYAKAILLLQDPSGTKNVQEISDLLEKYVTTDDLFVSDAYGHLVELIMGTPQCTLQYEKKLFEYLKNAVKCGNHNYAIDLAQYYRDGIKDDAGEYFLQPNIDQALHYLTLHIEQTEDNYKKEKAFMIRGFLYHEKNKEAYALKDVATSLIHKARALKDLEEALKYETTVQTQARLMLYIGILTMLIDNFEGVNEHALGHFILARDILNDCIRLHPEHRDYFVNILVSCLTDQEALDMACRTTLHILEKNNTSKSALQWCSILGHFLLEKSQEGIRYGKEMTATDLMYKNHALEILKYAARNNCPEAQWQLINIEGEVNLNLKLLYAMKVMSVGIETKNPLVPVFERKLRDIYIEHELNVIKHDDISLDRKIKHAEDLLKAYGNCDHPLIPVIGAQLIELYGKRTKETIQPSDNNIQFIHIPHTVEKKEESNNETPCIIIRKNKELEQHKCFNKLVHHPTSSYSSNKKYLEAVNIYPTKPTRAVALLQQLLKDNHPHAQLHLARHFFESDNETAQTYFQNSLRAGIIEEKNQPSRFIDSLMLNSLYAVTQVISIVDQQAHGIGSDWIKNMKTILIAKKINLPLFQQVLKDLYGFDITKNPGWQSKKSKKK